MRCGLVLILMLAVPATAWPCTLRPTQLYPAERTATLPRNAAVFVLWSLGTRASAEVHIEGPGAPSSVDVRDLGAVSRLRFGLLEATSTYDVEVLGGSVGVGRTTFSTGEDIDETPPGRVELTSLRTFTAEGCGGTVTRVSAELVVDWSDAAIVVLDGHGFALPGATHVTSHGVSRGRHCLVARAFDAAGNEGPASDPACIDVEEPAGCTCVRRPGAPAALLLFALIGWRRRAR